MTKLALIGAAGHMGTRAWDALGEESDFQVMCVESPKGESVLKDRGIVPVASEEAGCWPSLTFSLGAWRPILFPR